ncbi:MAG TPA: elongation factor G [Acidimicrobiales bacterium]|nr:elongation factor G [Acidimicrobiales bacterium]
MALAAVTTHRTRTVALVGHAGAGKTTLIERLLATTGAIPRAGSVLEGTTVCDTEPEEVARRHSLSMTIAPITLGEERIDLIDTPGVADFVVEVERALAVADVAVIVVSATDGVEVQTEVVWRLAGREGIPRVIVVTKLDREGARYEPVLASLRDTFGKGVAPVELPIGEGPAFRGVADLLADAAITYDGGAPKTEPVPDEIAEEEHRVREQLVEGIVLADDDLTARYLEGDALSMEELEAALSIGLADGSVVPVVCVSGETGIGVDRLASLLSELSPSRGVQGTRGGEMLELPRDPAGPPVLRAFKTVLDPFVGRITWLEVISGTVRPDDTLVNSRSRTDERLRSLQVPRGKELVAVAEVTAGDLVAVPKLADTIAGDVLAPKGFDVELPLPAGAAPTHEVAVLARKQGDEDKLMVGLHRLEEEDPGLRVRQDDEAHQTVLTVMGDTHLAVVLERLKRKYGVEVDVEERRHSYRRTILKPAAAEGRHKKQTGGHGQFAVAHLRLEPLPRGTGFEFVDQVVGGAIPRQFIPAVQHGVEKAMATGGNQGIPFVDIRVICDDGKHHSVDSSEAAFQMAGSIAFQDAVAAAGAVILEPISHVEVDVPTRFLGDVLSDLNSRRGRVVSSDPTDDGQTRVVALVPTTELSRYTTDLRGIAGGHGTFTTSFDHFAELPANLAAKVAAG